MDYHSGNHASQPNSDARIPQLKDVVEYIEQEMLQLRTVLFAGKVPSSRVTSFAIDLALIGFSLRAGHLVDAFFPKDPHTGFSALLHRLKQRLKLFQDVVHVYEPRSEQSFFINAPLLLAKLSPASWPVFVSTDDSPNILAEPPEDIPSLVQNLANQLLDRSSWNDASTIVLPDSLSVTSTVPLAALLLEYPVAYCPETIATGPFLSHVTLDVYEVFVQLLDNEDKALVQQQTWIPPSDILNRRHSILKFSCPSVLGISFPERLSPELLMGQLRYLFNSRITSEIAAAVIVHHSIETLDRVAL